MFMAFLPKLKVDKSVAVPVGGVNTCPWVQGLSLTLYQHILLCREAPFFGTPPLKVVYFLAAQWSGGVFPLMLTGPTKDCMRCTLSSWHAVFQG